MTLDRLKPFVAMLALALVAGLGQPARQLGAASKLEDLRGVDELKSLFNGDVGRVRLVLLLSPT